VLYRQELSAVYTAIQCTTTAVYFKWHIQHRHFVTTANSKLWCWGS